MWELIRSLRMKGFFWKTDLENVDPREEEPQRRRTRGPYQRKDNFGVNETERCFDWDNRKTRKMEKIKILGENISKHLETVINHIGLILLVMNLRLLSPSPLYFHKVLVYQSGWILSRVGFSLLSELSAISYEYIYSLLSDLPGANRCWQEISSRFFIGFYVMEASI